MKFYNGPYNALDQFKYNYNEVKHFSEKERKNLLIALFNNVDYVYFFIDNHYYENDVELTKAIDECLHYSILSAKLLINHGNLLTESQKKQALKNALNSWEGVQLLFKANMFNQEERMKAIEYLIVSPLQIGKLLYNNILFEDELEFIFNHLKDDIRNHSDVLKTILSKQKANTNVRKKVFALFISNKNTVYDLAYKERFLDNELKIAHDIYWGDLFNENKRCYKKLLKYCEAFIGVLNDIELKYLTKRLISNKKVYDITKFANNESIPETYRDKLNAYLVIHKLKAGY